MNIFKNKINLLYSLLICFSIESNAQVDMVDNINLDGVWDIYFDSENKALSQELYLDVNFSKTNYESINVPSVWELSRKDYEGAAIYRTIFTIPKEWEGRLVDLNFKSSNYKTEVWINDNPIGFHEGGFTPFSFNINRMVKYGQENTLTVRVIGPILLTDNRIDGMGRMEVPQWRGAITGGIWQSVSLRSSGQTKISDVYLEPNISNSTAKVKVDLYNSGVDYKEYALEIAIKNADGKVNSVKKVELDIQPGNSSQTYTLKIENAKYWSTDNPYLYQIDINLKGGGILNDSWSKKFGMREFTIKDNRFYLNNEPIYLKAAFFEGLYPRDLASPESREMAIKEIKLAKEAGFNMIRPWRKPPVEMWLDLCDSMGVMTVGSLVVECMERPLQTPYLPFRVENELVETLKRDRNRTCVVMWELFNELHHPILIQMLRPMSLKARDLDPSRLILDESGGWAEGAKMYLPYQRVGEKFNDIHNYAGPMINQSKYEGYLRIGQSKEQLKDAGLNGLKTPGRNVVPGLLSFVSELGYGSLPNLVENNKQFASEGHPLAPATEYHKRLEKELKQALVKTGFDKVYPDFEKFCLDQQEIHGEANKRMLEATRMNGNVIGYCVHALVAGDWVIGAGLLDLWRNPKTAVYQKTKEANAKMLLSARVMPRNIYSGINTEIVINGVNELKSINGTILVEIVSKKGEKVFVSEKNTEFANGISEMFSSQLETENLRGSYILNVYLKNQKGELIASNDCSFDVFSQKDLIAPSKKVSIIDPEKSLLTFLKKNGISYSEFHENQDISLPILVGKIPKEKESFEDIVKKALILVEKGAFIAFVESPASELPFFKRELNEVTEQELPFGAKSLPTLGLWAGRPHIVKDHPIFEGLPVNTIMKGVYENIHPTTSLMMQKGEYISGVVSYDHFKNIDKMLRHYKGPGDVWYAADMLLSVKGNGKMLISTFEILPNLNWDPAADLLLLNMIDFMD
jgi:beta-galactosidase